jgi:hypothetical protein
MMISKTDQVKGGTESPNSKKVKAEKSNDMVDTGKSGSGDSGTGMKSSGKNLSFEQSNNGKKKGKMENSK